MMRAANGLFVLYAVLLLAPPANAQERDTRPRIVAPEIIAVPPVDPTTLERAAPRDPLSGIGQARPPEDADTIRLFRPVATAAGRIESAGREVVIAGLRIIGPGRICDAPDGTWPCGMRARTAFRYWLRGRAVECARPDGAPVGDETVLRCRLGRQDVGAWLVANGWALAERGGPYEDEEDAARTLRRGVFGAPPGS